MATKKAGGKGDDNRVKSGRSGSAGRKTKEAPSAFGSPDGKSRKVNIWPEWSDADVNGEKWETAHKAKEKEKGKSPTSQNYFDDPDGKVLMPPSLKVAQWKRPLDIIFEKTPVVVDPEHIFGFDLLSKNEHLFYSETIRWIITQIDSMWSANATKATGNESPEVPVSPAGMVYNWRPWEHIYAISKIGKGPNIPQYNPSGKYVVKLYWLGCWRKITIDDSIPFDEQDKPLLPFTTQEHELWPMLLTKALLKVASLDYGGGCEVTEFGDFSVIHCLTGWLPQTVVVKKEQSHVIWKLLSQFLPEWKLPEPEKEKPPEEEGAAGSPDGAEKGDAKEAAPGGKDAKGKKDDKGAKGKDHPPAKDPKKDRGKGEKNLSEEANATPDKPQAVIFASYHDVMRKHPYPVQSLTEMADQSERLRRQGLSHLLSHPVALSQFRACPLFLPPPPEVIPAWKLIRPRVKKPLPKSDLLPSDEEPEKVEEEKPIQCVEIQSAFVQYKVSEIPIPTSTSRPISALQRGGAHPSAPFQPTISEDPPPPPQPIIPVVQVPPPADANTSAESTTADSKKTSGRPTSSAQGKPAPGAKDENVEFSMSLLETLTQVQEDGTGEESSATTDVSSLQALGGAVPTSSSKKSRKSSQPALGYTDSPVGSLASGDGKGQPAPSRKMSAVARTKTEAAPAPPPAATATAAAAGKHTAVIRKPTDEPIPPTEASPETVVEKEIVDLNVTKKMWMDLDKFCECFQALHIYHKVNSYPYQKITTDSKNIAGSLTASSPHKDGGGRKSTINPTVGSPQDDRSPQYLYVDSVHPSEIIFCLAALCRWNDPPTAAQPPTGAAPTGTGAPVPAAGTTPGPAAAAPSVSMGSQQNTQAQLSNSPIHTSSFVKDGIEQSPIRAPDLQAASMISEWHYWKQLRIGDQFKRMTTTGIKAVSLRLPPGRHCLKMYVRAPLGYHLTLLSAHPFVYGDEDAILPQTKQQPLRLLEYGQNLVHQLCQLIDVYSDEEKRPAAEEEYIKMHCPFIRKRKTVITKRSHFQIYRDAFYQTLKKALGDKVSADLAFAWRVVNMDAVSTNPLGLQYMSQPQAFPAAQATKGGSRGAKGDSKKPQVSSTTSLSKEDTDGKSDQDSFHGWTNREVTVHELSSIVNIQRVFRGYFTRKILRARNPAAPEHKRVVENLLKTKTLLEANSEQTGVHLLNLIFQMEPQALQYFVFAKDFDNYCTYQDYQGSYPEQLQNTLFLVFREIFHVRGATANAPPPASTFAFPKIVTQPHIPTCYVRIINNDTGEELERTLGERNVPRDFPRNQKGYSFVAVAKTGDQPLPFGRWKFRVIGHGGQPFLQPAHTELTSNFVHQELMDYYVPNKENIVMRQLLSVSGEDHLATLHFRASKQDVPLTLQVLDYEDVIISSSGLGQVIIPAVLLQKEFGSPLGSDAPDEGAQRSSSRQSLKTGAGGGQGRKKGSAKSTRLSPHGSVGSGLDGMGEAESGIRLHKYSVVASVKPNSWPLSKANWTLVESLKQLDVEEMKMNGKPREVSPPRLSNAPDPKKDGPGGAGKGGKAAGKAGGNQPGGGKDGGKAGGAGGKGGAAGGGAGKNKEDPNANRPESVTLDITKAHWTLRAYSDGQVVEDLTIKRDTEKSEEIRAMKKAWEEMEPGRAERARQSRLRYLNARMVKNPDYVTPEPPKTPAPEEVPPPAAPSAAPAGSLPPLVPPLPTGEEDEEEQVLTFTPPSADKVPELILPPVDLTPYQRGDPAKARYLDYETRMQTELQWKQRDLQRYRAMMEEWDSWCLSEKLERNLAKSRQLEVAKRLQARLDHARFVYYCEMQRLLAGGLAAAADPSVGPSGTLQTGPTVDQAGPVPQPSPQPSGGISTPSFHSREEEVFGSSRNTSSPTNEVPPQILSDSDSIPPNRLPNYPTPSPTATMMGRQMKTSEAATVTADEVSNIMNVNVRQGLSRSEIDRRHQVHGFNEFMGDAAEPLWKKYLEQFREPMILLLLGSAFVSVVMHQFDDALSITVAIFIVVTVAFIQGYRSEKAIEALKELLPPRCQCLRDGTSQVLYARELVPGDVVYLQMGDRVPADLRLFEATDLCVDESSFTGETEPVHKMVSAVTSVQSKNIPLKGSPEHTSLQLCEPSETPVAEHRHTIVSNMTYLGTLVRCGSGKGIVTATGAHSEFGELFQMMQGEEAPRTPLQKSMDVLGKHLTMYSFVIIGGIVILGIIQHRKWLEMFTIAVSLAVAAIPEGLPIVVTVTLAIGQMRMAKRNAIVKKLPAVETLGCVNVVCCDKTGTLTKNEMTVVKAVTCDGTRVNVTGVGYTADGEVWLEDMSQRVSPDTHPSVRMLAEIGCVCNNAYIINGELRGQPTEGALLCFAAKMKLADMRQEYTRLQETPFNSDTKIMTVRCVRNRRQPIMDVQNSMQSGEEVVMVKGAADRVLKQCSHAWSEGGLQPLTSDMEARLNSDAALMGRQGLRVVALAKSVPGNSLQLACYGLIGIMDPPRPGVELSVAALQRGGVRVCMLTGDSMETACAIAHRLGLYHGVELCWSGDDVENMSVEQMTTNIHNCAVFYRTTPRHKFKIVKAYQQRGYVVAMTGDGVNDAVALKCADIGLAMGRSGTDVCKEAADIVLVDDDFSTILAAMEEGKAIFYNIRNFVRFQLSTSIAALSLISLSTLFSLPNPLNAMQILWINILMDGPPAQSLGVEPVDSDVIRQPPRSVKERILSGRLLTSIVISAVVIVTGTLWVFHREMAADGKVTPRDTTMTFTCFVLFDMFNALSSRSQTKSIFSVGFTTNRFFIIAVGLSLVGQLMVIYFPPLQAVFQTEALYPSDLLLLVGVASSIFWISEAKKYFERFGVSGPLWHVFRRHNGGNNYTLRRARVKTSESDNFI